VTAIDVQGGEGARPATKRDLRQRNDEIKAWAARGLKNSALGQMFQLTPQQIGRILAKAHESARPLSAVDAERELQTMLEALDQVIEDFALEYRRTEHGGYRIAAIRGRVEVLMLRLELQARAGLIPRSLAQPAQQAEVAALLTEFVKMLERHHASEAMLRDALEITERVHGGRRLPTVDAKAVAA
jgi:hypothetical protein